jgi:hypothetical protein
MSWIMGKLSKVLIWLRGKKTHITGLVIGLTGVLKYYGIDIPEGVFEVLAGLGLITLRKGVEDAKNESV